MPADAREGLAYRLVRRPGWRGISARLGPALLAAVLISSPLLSLAQTAPDRHLPAPVEGRWQDKGSGLTLDISRCGTRFCGRHVVDGKCDRTVLRMDQQPIGDQPLLMALKGDLDIPGKAVMPQAYATVSGQGDNLRLGITGADGGVAPLTRRMVMRIELSPIGRATCPAGATS